MDRDSIVAYGSVHILFDWLRVAPFHNDCRVFVTVCQPTLERFEVNMGLVDETRDTWKEKREENQHLSKECYECLTTLLVPVAAQSRILILLYLRRRWHTWELKFRRAVKQFFALRDTKLLTNCLFRTVEIILSSLTNWKHVEQCTAIPIHIRVWRWRGSAINYTRHLLFCAKVIHDYLRSHAAYIFNEALLIVSEYMF